MYGGEVHQQRTAIEDERAQIAFERAQTGDVRVGLPECAFARERDQLRSGELVQVGEEREAERAAARAFEALRGAARGAEAVGRCEQAAGSEHGAQKAVEVRGAEGRL